MGPLQCGYMPGKDTVGARKRRNRRGREVEAIVWTDISVSVCTV